MAQSEYARYKAERNLGARDFGRYVQALAMARGNIGNAVVALDRWRLAAPRIRVALEAMLESPQTLDDMVVKGLVAAGSASDSTWAGPLAPVYNLGSEFVEYMRPLHILGRLPYRKVPFNVKFARTTTGAANAGWVGQGLAQPVTALAFDSLQLTYAKVSGISVFTEEVMRSQSYDAPGLISNDLAAAAATFLDEALLDPDRVAVIDTSPASITNGQAQITSSGLTPADLVADSKAAMRVLDAVRIPLEQCTWVMTQDVAIYISTLLTYDRPAGFPGLRARRYW